MKKKKSLLKIVEIEWRDPSIDEGWIGPHHSPHEEELPLFKAYGILVKKTKKQIVLAGGYAPEDGDFCDRSTFPIGCVHKITILKEVKL